MNEQTREQNENGNGLIRPPAYPWTAREILAELRTRLEEQLQEPMRFRRLGELVGERRRTAFYWFEECPQRPLLGFFCCLERLTDRERHALIDRYCRIFPSLEHPDLAHSRSKVQKLHGLLQKSRGLTIATGTELSRCYLVHAMGHSYRRHSSKGNLLVGIDLNRPTRFVPLETCSYFDGSAGIDRVRPAVMKAWPKVLTSSATLIVLNGVWAMQELREDILRLAARTHVLLAAAEPLDMAIIRRTVFTPVHLLTLSESKSVEGRVRIDCRRIKPLKRPKKGGNRKKGCSIG